jgi:hypothetical protein
MPSCENCGYVVEVFWRPDGRRCGQCGLPESAAAAPAAAAPAAPQPGKPRPRRIQPVLVGPPMRPLERQLQVGPHAANRQAAADEPPAQRFLRLMVWNVETLGGGFRHGPVRSDAVMRATARVIYLIRPDICALLEVMGRSRRHQPKGRKRQVWGKRTGRKTKAAPPPPPAAAVSDHPGLEEVARLVTAINQIAAGNGDPARWQCTTVAGGPVGGYTKNETYSFLYRSDPAEINFLSAAYVDEEYPEGSGTKLGFPNAYFRRPMIAEFQLSGSLAGRNQQPWTLPFLAFHAPAPSHPERFEAIANLARIKRVRDGPEIVIGADTNVDSEAVAYGEWEKVLTCLDYGFDEALSEQDIQRWTGEDVGRSSHRRKPILHDNEALQDRGDAAVQAALAKATAAGFLNCAYDKLWLLTKDGPGGDVAAASVLRNPDVHVFNLIHAAQAPQPAGAAAAPAGFQEPDRRRVFDDPNGVDDPAIAGCLGAILETQPGHANAIAAANTVSDHSPIYMIAEILGDNRGRAEEAVPPERPPRRYFFDADGDPWDILRIDGSDKDSFFNAIRALWREGHDVPTVEELRAAAGCAAGGIDPSQIDRLARRLQWLIIVYITDRLDTEVERVYFGAEDGEGLPGGHYALDVLLHAGRFQPIALVEDEAEDDEEAEAEVEGDAEIEEAPDGDEGDDGDDGAEGDEQNEAPVGGKHEADGPADEPEAKRKKRG